MSTADPEPLGRFRVERWLDDAGLGRIEYSAYWNNEAAERDKEWWVLDGDFERMERHLERSRLDLQLQTALEAARDSFGFVPGGNGADLAAGSLWAVPRLLAAGPVERIYAVEYSAHRLLKLGPVVLEHYGVDPRRVVLCLGSFYELELDDNSLDFVFLSQALHHADDPVALLREIRRVLQPGGVALVIGEHIAERSARAVIRAAARSGAARLPMRAQRRLFGRTLTRSSAGRDPLLGDHWYTGREYRRMFAEAGFAHVACRPDDAPMQCFVLQRA